MSSRIIVYLENFYSRLLSITLRQLLNPLPSKLIVPTFHKHKRTHILLSILTTNRHATACLSSLIIFFPTHKLFKIFRFFFPSAFCSFSFSFFNFTFSRFSCSICFCINSIRLSIAASMTPRRGSMTPACCSSA